MLAEPQFNPPCNSLPIIQERAESDRRSGHDRRNLNPQEAELLRSCRLAGVLFMGIQKTYGHPPGDLCLFQKAKYATTLALPVNEVTALTILEHLAESERKFAALPPSKRPYSVAITTGESRTAATA